MPVRVYGELQSATRLHLLRNTAKRCKSRSRLPIPARLLTGQTIGDHNQARSISIEKGGSMTTEQKDIVLGLISGGLTLLASALVTRGVIDESQSMELVGGILAIVGVFWGVRQTQAARKDKTP